MHLAIWVSVVFIVLSGGVAKAQDCECPEEVPECCTFSQGKWKNFNALKPENSPQHVPWPERCFGEKTVSETAELWPGQTMLDILSLPVAGSSCINLAKRWISATLNRCINACGDVDPVAEEVVLDALAQADALLHTATLCPGNLGAQTSFTAERTHALELAAILGAYNNGILLGPGECDTKSEAIPPPRGSGGGDANPDVAGANEEEENDAVAASASAALAIAVIGLILGVAAVVGIGFFLSQRRGSGSFGSK